MFAYCGNNPINRSDPSGHIWRIVLLAAIYAITITACSADDYGAASDYVEIPAAKEYKSEQKLRKENANCYSYAIGIYDRSYDPGDFSKTSYGTSVQSVAICVINDFTTQGRSIRILEDSDSPISENEYRIALRVSDYNPERSIPWDYHFMVQTSTGLWAEKHGPGGATVLHQTGTPDTISWDCGDYIGFYTSDIVYFAISPS